jgi:hypothetical protein
MLRKFGFGVLIFASFAAASAADKCSVSEKKIKVNEVERNAVVLENASVRVEILPQEGGRVWKYADKRREKSAFETLSGYPYASSCAFGGECSYTIDKTGPERAAVVLRYDRKIEAAALRELGLDATDVELKVERTISIEAGTSRLTMEIKVTNAGTTAAPEFTHAIEARFGEVEPLKDIGNACWFLPVTGNVEYFDGERGRADMAEANYGSGAPYHHRFSAFTPGRAAELPRYEARGWAALQTSAGPAYLNYDPADAAFIQYEYNAHPEWSLTLAPHSKLADLKPGESRAFSVTLAYDWQDVPERASGIVLQKPVLPQSVAAGQNLATTSRVTEAIPVNPKERARVWMEIKDPQGAVVHTDKFDSAVESLRWNSVSFSWPVPQNAAPGEYTCELRLVESGTPQYSTHFDVTTAVSAEMPVAPAPAVNPAIQMAPKRLEQLKKGGEWWYDYYSGNVLAGSLHLTLQYDEKENSFALRKESRTRDGAVKTELVYKAEAAPQLKSFLQEQPTRKSPAKGIVDGNVLKGIDADGDAYALPYSGDLIPDCAASFAAMAMDWSRARKFSFTLLETADQDVLPPQAIFPRAEKKPAGGRATIPCTTVHIGENYYSVDESGRILEISNASYALRWVLTDKPKYAASDENDARMPEGPDEAEVSAAISKALKNPPATGQLVQSASAHASKLGLAPGDIVSRYDGANTETLGHLRSAMSGARSAHKKNVEIEVWHAGAVEKLTIPIGQIGIQTCSVAKGVETNLDDATFGGMGFGPGPRPPMSAYEKLAREKCGSQLAWLSDYSAALAEAKAQNKVVLWWASPIHGSSIYKLDLFSDFLNMGLFTDPDTVAYVKANFITYQAPLTKKQMDAFGLKFMTGPAFLFVSGDGKLIHYVDGLTTIQKDFFQRMFAAVLSSAGQKIERPAAQPPTAVAQLYSDGVALYLHNKTDEAIAVWKKAVAKDAGDPWAWRAAAELEGIGPLAHGIESLDPLPDAALAKDAALEGLPHTTRGVVMEADLDKAARVGVEYLLEHQSSDGGWNDTSYDFGGLRAMPNVRSAVTAICAEALLAHRDVAVERVDTALNRAFAYLTDEKHINTDDKNEVIWPHIYRMNFYAAWLKSCSAAMKPKLLHEMQTLSTLLTQKHLSATGFFRHEYENDFVTGSVLLSLKLAKDAGISVDDRAVGNALDALETLRSPRGTFPYDPVVGSGPVAWKGSAGRTINCEAALLAWGRSSAERLRVAIEKYIQYNFVQERVRKQTFHSDAYAIGGFFYWYNQHVLSQVALMTDAATAKKAAAFMQQMALETREVDGTWVDSIELGKTYATGMALLVLDVAKRVK